MKRFRLSAKLALAVIPIGLVALLAVGFIANSFLQDSTTESESARAATVTAEALDALNAVWAEHGEARQLYVFFDSGATEDYATAIEQTDVAFNRLSSAIAALASATSGLSNQVAVSADEQVDLILADLERIRSIGTPTGTEVAGYATVQSSLLSLMPKASSLVSDREQARDLSTAYFLAEGGQVSLQQEQLVEEFRATAFPSSSATATSNSRNTLQVTLDLLEDDFASWGVRASQTASRTDTDVLEAIAPIAVEIDTFPTQRNDEILDLSEGLTAGVTSESIANAGRSEREAYLVAGVTAIVLLLALWGAFAVIRSIIRRVRDVTTAAVQVSEVDLPNLVEALQNPNEGSVEFTPTTIEGAGSDEVGELANSFASMHSTLIDVAGQQMEILRRGVSEIFVTLARRNRSLVDRQLALLDELESREEDAETLGGYYKLDHLATRMRRNAESLLVLAGSEPTRVWDNPLDVSEIIRAALGEVDEYQRVDIMALEPALISGRAVADIAHLMSELLDNGTQYSSPSDRVRVAGLFDPEGYMLTVSDSGIGVTDAKLAELNEMLSSPPVLGLALQPTLGMYVVARLAARHSVKVKLISGSPGLTIRVLLPKDLIEAAKPKEEVAEVPTTKPAPEPVPTAPFRPEPVATNGGARSGASYLNDREEKTQPSLELEAKSGNAVLPGSIVGKHEHPGRQQPGRIEVDDGTFEFESFGEVAETPEVASPEGLARRIPGDALRQEQQNQFVEPEPIVDVEPIDRPESDDSPWWAKDLSGKESENHPDRTLWEADAKEEVAIDDAEVPAVEEAPTQPRVVRFAPAGSGTSEPSNRGPDRSVVSEAGLPVRTPGVSFRETDDSDVSSAASESGAIGIKSALASYAGGKAMAKPGEQGDTEFDEERE